ncbi:hypothetical protein PC119_g9358 [Phytophthora cactorum]|nr:hypothetical protein PC119_g9358 [Phytophthora cactorum]KAG3142453.1 hypothetical protein PC128_g24773 [Phytophthora cactorum]
MEYTMPLVDDLQTELEHYLWVCSLDAASGFWAVMVTRRARKISAFVWALGHFEWLRMPFGVKNAPMIYQQMINNALWGFVQPVADGRITLNECAMPNCSPLRSVANLTNHRWVMDPLQVLFDSLEAKMFTTGEPDELSPVPVFEHMSFVNDICFGGETFDSCLATLDRLLSRFGKWGLTKSLFIKSKVSFLSHEVSRVGIRADPKKMQAIATLPFPTSKKGM